MTKTYSRSDDATHTRCISTASAQLHFLFIQFFASSRSVFSMNHLAFFNNWSERARQKSNVVGAHTQRDARAGTYGKQCRHTCRCVGYYYWIAIRNGMNSTVFFRTEMHANVKKTESWKRLALNEIVKCQMSLANAKRNMEKKNAAKWNELQNNVNDGNDECRMSEMALKRNTCIFRCI